MALSAPTNAGETMENAMTRSHCAPVNETVSSSRCSILSSTPAHVSAHPSMIQPRYGKIGADGTADVTSTISDIQTKADGMLAQMMDQQKDQIRQSILQRKRQEAIQLYISSLKEKMQKEGKVRVNDKELDKLAAAASQRG